MSDLVDGKVMSGLVDGKVMSDLVDGKVMSGLVDGKVMSGLVDGKVDILLISETKIENTSPTPQFEIPSSPSRLDRSKHGRSLLSYVNEDIPSKFLPAQSFCTTEWFTVVLKIHKKKWIMFGIYNPTKSLISNHLSTLSRNIEHYLP